jgi:hypothetical protein
VGRLKPGASIEQAQANFATVFLRTAIAGMAAYQSSLTPDETWRGEPARSASAWRSAPSDEPSSAWS